MGNKKEKSNLLKKCFIITPIGNPKTDIREKTDGVINAIIKPVLKDLEYEVIPPHEMTESGSITQKIIEHIINDDLVIANLTGLNANVMYELAIRHAVRKPVVCIVERNTSLPFDVVTERFIMYDDNFSNVLSLKDNIKKAIISSESEIEIDNPIYRAIKEVGIIKKISDSNDPNSNVLKIILNRLVKIEKNTNTTINSRRDEFVSNFGVTIELSDNKIGSDTIYKINSLIANEFISNNITVAIVYDESRNEITIQNGNFHDEIMETLIFNIESNFGLSNIKYTPYPF